MSDTTIMLWLISNGWVHINTGWVHPYKNPYKPMNYKEAIIGEYLNDFK